MKKFFTFFLVLVLAMSSLQMPVYAENDEDQDATTSEIENETQDEDDSIVSTDDVENGNDSTTTTDDEAVEEDEYDASEKGKVKVVINTQFTKKNIDSLSAKLSNPQFTYSGNLDPTRPNSQIFLFDDVVNGTYTLSIQGDGYETVKKEITVNNDETIVKYVNTNLVAENIKDNGFGTLAYGDFNNDGIIDEEDKKILSTAIFNHDSSNALLDIDANGQVDLLDLNAFTYVYSDHNSDDVKRLEAEIETFPLLVNNVSVNVDEMQGTIEGNIEDILEASADREAIKLSPQNEGDISVNNPIQLSLDIQEPIEVTQLTIQGTNDNTITKGSVIIVDENGEEYEVVIGEVQLLALHATRQAMVQDDGSIVIDLGTQIAVKKVTIRITATSSKSLAEISKVEFLNGMEDHIPEPKLDIPSGLAVDELDEELYIKWNALNNVTGYKVKVAYEGQEEEYASNINTYSLKSFNGKDLLNGKTYTISVKAINDADKDSLWESAYSDEIEATPQAAKVPAAPDYVRANGAYRSINVSWKDMKSTDSYNVFYREKGKGEYIEAVSSYKGTSYTIDSLKDNVTYEVYVSGNNKMGTGPGSLVSEATTITIMPAQLPQYKLLNTSNGKGELSSHIVNVYYGKNGVTQIINSPLDEASTTTNSALALVDNDYESYMQIKDWDFGVSYHHDWRLTFEFDDTYEMNYISFAGPINDSSINGMGISYFNEEGKEVEASIDAFRRLTDVNGRIYYIAHLSNPLKSDKVRVGVQGSVHEMRLAEFNFYYYDSLENDVNNLFTDAFHLTLREDVTASTVEDLQKRLNTPDEVSKELHPFKDLIQMEINQAKQVVEGTALKEVQEIHNGISAHKQGSLGFGGLNSWQPLGYVTYPGDTLIVYVGQEGKRNGQAVNLQLVYSQYHAEAASFIGSPINLKVGKNEINTKQLQSIGVEKGGSVYVQYTGNSNEKIAVRVSGGAKIATLDLYHVSDPSERLERVKTYLQSLQTQLDEMNTKHGALHQDHQSVDYDYDEQNCILGASEIMLDYMLYSVSGKQIMAGLKGSTLDEKAEHLLNSLDAMDQMMELFYQNKGLNKNAASITDRYPAQHLNIRYHRMFAGAFMYASGNHIGIEWGSVSGLSNGIPFVATEDGKYISGASFGWGISHEIGHDINQGCYAIAEITNNYFALLSQNRDSNATTRFKYPSVYEKVTSNTEGVSSNVFTQLAMYWQLHLAYDQNYHYKLYDSHEEQLDALFFARVDYYARNPGKAPIPEGGIALKLDGDAKQNIIRLASVAAQKDLTDFFTAWGIIPNAQTKAFISQFEPETKKIQYLDDDSMAYRLEGYDRMSSDTAVKAELFNAVNSNQVTLTISNTNEVDGAMLGYEILRNGQAVGFINAQSGETTFTDTVSTVNNRVFTYSVIGYDRLLNQTEELVLDPIKISHDGSLDKAGWLIDTNLVSSSDATIGDEDSTPCAPESKAVNDLIDDNYQNVYQGSTSSNQGEFILSLNALADVTGIKLTNPSFDEVQIYVSTDKNNWTLVKEDSLEVDKENKLYFSQLVDGELVNNQSLVSYASSYIKIVAVDENEVSLSEIDVLGPSGDNIDMAQENSIGILKNDYVLDEDNIIPKGSLIFTGTYAGNPAYNVVELRYNQDEILSGYQAIFAEDPKDEDLADVSEGTWIYYLIPGTDENGSGFGYYDDDGKFVKVEIPSSIYPQLYRVNDAQTNAGQRLVSDSFEVEIPTELPEIEIGNQKRGGN